MDGMNACHEKVRKIRNETYYTIFGASEQLDISVSTLKREINRKHIRFLKHPKGIMFHPSWLDEFLERKTTIPKKKM